MKSQLALYSSSFVYELLSWELSWLIKHMDIYKLSPVLDIGFSYVHGTTVMNVV